VHNPLSSRTRYEYFDKELALLDAIEAATDARDGGQDAEVWDGPGRVY